MKVKFEPQGVELDIGPDESVMDLAHSNGVEIKSVCNGMPSCAECRVRVVEGMHNVLPPSAKELSLIGTGYFIDQRRLSCQLKCFGDITVDLAEQVEKAMDSQVRRPQGAIKKDEAEKSHAVAGSLLEQEEDLVRQAESEAESEQKAKPQPRSAGRGERDAKSGEGRSRNRNSRGRGRGRNRNRNRSRSKRNDSQ